MPYKDTEKRREYQREYMRQWYQAIKPSISVRRNRDERLKWLKEYKNLLVGVCGETHYACLEFHHIDPREKKFRLEAIRRPSLKALQAEIAKCRVLCANCHRKEHWKQRLEQNHAGSVLNEQERLRSVGLRAALNIRIEE